MSWKLGSSFKNISITKRLSILYIVTTSIMLFIFSLYSYWSLTDNLSNANEKFLQDIVKVFRNIILKHPNSHDLLVEEMQWNEELQASEYHYFAKITDPQNNIYAITQGMNDLFKGVIFPAPAKSNESIENTSVWTSPTGNKYLLASAWAKASDNKNNCLIQIAIDLTEQQQIIASYRYNLLVVFLIGIVLAALLSLWITKKSMQKLTEISGYAEKISISKLDAINIGDCPKELKNLVSAFNKMLLRIENAFTSLSLFSNELAHELRTPINNLRGEAEIILSKKRSANEYEEVIMSSLEEYLRLSTMIENILFLAKTENPALKLVFNKIALSNEFETVIEKFEPLLNQKNIQASYYSNDILTAEPNLLRRALNNLLSNAIKYTQEGGTIKLLSQQIANNIIITLSDNGIGINSQHISRVFDRFYRVKNELGSNYGLGLGLSIVKSIMELHNGHTLIESRPSNGTTIQLVFPHSS